MEATAALRSSSAIPITPNLIGKSAAFVAYRSDFLIFSTKFRFSNGWMKNCPLISHTKQGQRRSVSLNRINTGIRALSGDSTWPSSTAPIAPLQLESPTGQFLSQILISHPHLLPAAVDQQLQQLQTDREAEKQKELKEEPSTSGTHLILYRRIAEVKANERKKALEEILYTLIVQKFMDAQVSLIPAISQSTDPSGRVDAWPNQEEKLVRLHSPEAYEMIKNHLAIILGNRLVDSNSVQRTSKLRVGQAYAASVMYGYFLKRVDQRFQLEKTIKALPFGSDEEKNAIEQVLSDDSRPNSGMDRVENSHKKKPSLAGGISAGGFGYGIKSTRLRSYVMSFDAETLQRYATIRSKEAVSIIEKHTEALFGRPEVVVTPRGTIDYSKDEVINISFAGLQRLVLEAVTFGSFLWDVESYVDSRYHFVMN